MKQCPYYPEQKCYANDQCTERCMLGHAEAMRWKKIADKLQALLWEHCGENECPDDCEGLEFCEENSNLSTGDNANV